MSDQQKPTDRISVIVPENPFAPIDMRDKHCLCAIDVDDLMDLWPGTPAFPSRDPKKVKSIQRSLDWKRVAHIAAYLLQDEIIDGQQKLDQYFSPIYEPKNNEPGREWPPKVNKIISYQPSEFPIFSNILIHVNGAKLEKIKNVEGAGELIYNKRDPKLKLSVIDGQHRINGAYFALCLRRESEGKDVRWKIPAEIFLELDPPDKFSIQAQIFIDVNFNQKKVDKSLVVDLYPTTRVATDPENIIQRAQDIGRRLMLENEPLKGLIQIPGIRYGAKNVISLATLVGAIENVLKQMNEGGISSLEMQSDFISQGLTAWLEASGRFESKNSKKKNVPSSQNVVYQGRILESVISLIPAMIWKLKNDNIKYVSDEALEALTKWLKSINKKANFLKNDIFIDKNTFKKLGYLGSGGIAQFRNSLWAVIKGDNKIARAKPEKIAEWATQNHQMVLSEI